MIRKIYCVYDAKAEAYLQPFFCDSKGLAIRGFTDEVNKPTSPFNKWAADFTLFELGSFDDSSAKFLLHSTPISVGVALEFVNAVKDPKQGAIDISKAMLSGN